LWSPNLRSHGIDGEIEMMDMTISVRHEFGVFLASFDAVAVPHPVYKTTTLFEVSVSTRDSVPIKIEI
jgi:hypothetical protein